ncbi:MAG: flagellar hook-associated protein FlgK [Rhodocyclaceae bacterium]|nr:flagellar hook-associated protein FlgK [Rhodocyclaceae bacterium]
MSGKLCRYGFHQRTDFMGSGFLNIGVSGLNAANVGLLTTSHNISNASTPGYNRQQIVQTTNTPLFTGAGFIGQGTAVQTVKRIYDQFLTGQILSAQTGASEMDAYLAQIQQIDNLLADPDAGLSPALSAFFDGVGEVAANPSSIAARQSMLSAAQSLVARFQAIDNRLNEIREGTNTQVTGEVSAINTLVSQIAETNQRIILAQAAGSSQPANDLLDLRDQLIAELNQEIRVQTVADPDGTVSVFIGNGQPVVVGSLAFTLEAIAAPEDSEKITVALQAPGGSVVYLQEDLLTGGKLGGLIKFRNESLDSVQNGLGRIALALGQNVNDQHQLGQDLTGALGTAFFDLGSPTLKPNALNTGGGVPAVSIADVGQLTTSDYRLSYDGATYTLLRLSDDTVVASVASLAPAITVDGMTIGAGTWAANANDSILIQPTRTGAHDLGVAVTDARNIAAAAPMRSAAAVANTGTGRISAGSVDAPPPPNANLRNTVTITFDNPPGTFDVFDATLGVSLATNVAYTPGADISYNGWTAQITGTPAAGDGFTVASNANGVSDNRNAVALAALQTAKAIAGGTASYTSAYAQIVSQVGTKTAEVETIGKSQQALADQTESQRQSVSGVNLDEEAANMLRYQQAYQAAAKMIDIAGTLFEEILALGR